MKLKQSTLKKHCRFIKLNGPENKPMKKKYQIESYPTIVKVDGKDYEKFTEERKYKKLYDFLK